MAFHEVRFPDNISRGARGGPERRTQIVELASGAEERNASWANSRRRYDVAYGIRRADDLAAVVAFFEARGGRLHGFRFKDWGDHKSCLPSGTPSPSDQQIGTGDGFGDRARPGLRAGGVAFGQLKQGRRAVAGAYRLVGRAWRLRWQARLEVGPVLEAEAIEAPVPRLEERHHRRQIVGAADTIGDVVAAARVGPAGVAFLGARGQFDDLRAALWAAARTTADVVRKPDLVKCHGGSSHAAAAERHGAGDVARDLRA